jgi:RNA polymerase sigma-70 factor (ECF subfamily)
MAPLATFEDSALIRLALAGQTECFAVLTNRHLPAVKRRICAIVPNASDREDVLQEALLKVWRHLASFRSQSSFRTWMTRVAINEVRQSYRRARCRPICQTLDDLNSFTSPRESPLQSLIQMEVAQRVRSAVAGLPDKYKRVLILREFEERATKDVADQLHVSVPAVKTRLCRARQMLLAALQRSSVPDLAVQDWASAGRASGERPFEERRNAA